jgi:oxygen-dependent protoporphyrinogen oxidase
VTQLPAADAVILTTPANVSAGLIGDSPEAAAILGAVQFASVVFVTVGYERASIEHPLDGSGFLLPRDAGFDITAASWASTKWAHLADNEVVLLRVALGHVHDPRPIEWSDAEITDAVRRDLQSTMGISATPLDMRITRYRDGFPQYGVGHLDRIAKLEAALARDLPHVGLCGMAHRGVGIPACIREARRAVREVVARD